jgi:hypothetical protein
VVGVAMCHIHSILPVLALREGTQCVLAFSSVLNGSVRTPCGHIM